MRWWQSVLAAVGLLAWSVGVWTQALPVPLEVAIRTGAWNVPHHATPAVAQVYRLTARAGASQLVLKDALPPGMPVAGLLVWVHRPFGTSQGLEQVAVGTRTQYQRLGLLTGTQWHPGMPGVVVDAEETAVVLTALGGRFDGEGLVELRVLPLLLPGVDAGR